MSVYCNVLECGNWKAIEEKVRQPRGRGYVPIGDIGLYKGQCGLNRVNIAHKEFRGLGGSRNKLAVCDNFSIEEGSNVQDSSTVNCLELKCRFNFSGDPSREDCDQVNEGKDLYIEMVPVRDGIEQVDVPVCKSYVLRHREGMMSIASRY